MPHLNEIIMTPQLLLWFSSFLILLFSFSCLVRKISETLTLKAQIEKIINLIQPVGTKEEFCSKITEISSKIIMFHKISNFWQKFVNQLILIETTNKIKSKKWEEEKNYMLSTKSPEFFFNTKNLNDFPNNYKKNLYFLTAILISSYCTYAFYKNNIFSSNISIKILVIQGSQSFFILFSAIVYNKIFDILNNYYQEKLTKTIYFLNTAIGSKIKISSVEKIQHEQIASIKIQLEKQNHSFDLITSYIELEKSKSSPIEKSMIQMAQVIENKIVPIIKPLLEEIQNTTRQFKNLDQSFDRIIQSVSKEQRELCKIIENTNTSINEKTKNLLEISQESVSKTICEWKNGLNSSVGESSKMLSSILIEVSNMAKTLSYSAKDSTSQWAQLIEESKDHAQSIVLAQHEMTKLINPLFKSTERIAYACDQNQNFQQEAAQTLKLLNCLVSEISRIHSEMNLMWKKQEHTFIGIDQTIQSAFSKTNEAITTYTHKFKDLTKSFDQHMSKGMLTLAGAVGNLNHVVEKIPKNPNIS